MSFIKDLQNNEKVKTENGADCYKNSGHYLLDLNFKVPSFRNKIDFDLFKRSFKEDPIHTLKWLLYLRDIQNGIGERKSFREFLLNFCYEYPYLAKSFFKEVSIPEYGRWDDLIYIYCNLDKRANKIKKIIIDYIDEQIDEDILHCLGNQPISLLAKWLPSRNASSKKTRANASKIIKGLHSSDKYYKEICKVLRSYLNIVEINLSNKNYKNIIYKEVPSKANIRYKNAFIINDPERRKKYLEDLKAGKTKINANSMFLYDIIFNYFESKYFIKPFDTTLEELWKAQKKVEGFSDTLIVRDGSASMSCSIGNSSITAQNICDSITLYAAENNIGEYHNKFITFSSKPEIVDLDGQDTLHDKLEYLRKFDECSSTNIEATFDLILNTAIKYKTKQEDLPKQVLIISDMEFDGCGCCSDFLNKTLFENITDKFSKNGYKVPRLIFWNVNSRTNTVPLQDNELGIILISGFSKNLFDMILSSELDPYKALIKLLDVPKYSIIDDLLCKSVL